MEYKKIPIKKSLGQNFLIDSNIINKIIQNINPNENETVIEIGPGRGALTIPLNSITKNLHAVEIDPLLCKYLDSKSLTNLTLHNQDILNWNFDNLLNKNNIIIVGNLPYYITSPIIFKFIKEKFWREMTFMVQKEVASRIIANENSKDYSRISVMCQTFCNVSLEFNVSKNVFHPKPKVDSAIIKFKTKKNNINLDKFSAFIKIAFSHRRKTLKNNFKKHLGYKIPDKYHSKRAEQISVENFIKLFKKISI